MESMRLSWLRACPRRKCSQNGVADSRLFLRLEFRGERYNEAKANHRREGRTSGYTWRGNYWMIMKPEDGMLGKTQW